MRFIDAGGMLGAVNIFDDPPATTRRSVANEAEELFHDEGEDKY
jgi:hypothetical protein